METKPRTKQQEEQREFIAELITGYVAIFAIITMAIARICMIIWFNS